MLALHRLREFDHAVNVSERNLNRNRGEFERLIETAELLQRPCAILLAHKPLDEWLVLRDEHILLHGRKLPIMPELGSSIVLLSRVGEDFDHSPWIEQSVEFGVLELRIIADDENIRVMCTAP